MKCADCQGPLRSCNRSGYCQHCRGRHIRHRPPAKLFASPVWHAVCLPCWRGRKPKGPEPKYRGIIFARCCFCGVQLTRYRLRVHTFVPCGHMRKHRANPNLQDQ